jgi:hypothetical protein
VNVDILTLTVEEREAWAASVSNPWIRAVLRHAEKIAEATLADSIWVPR